MRQFFNVSSGPVSTPLPPASSQARPRALGATVDQTNNKKHTPATAMPRVGWRLVRGRFPKILDVVEPCVDALIAVGKSGERQAALFSTNHRSSFLTPSRRERRCRFTYAEKYTHVFVFSRFYFFFVTLSLEVFGSCQSNSCLEQPQHWKVKPIYFWLESCLLLAYVEQYYLTIRSRISKACVRLFPCALYCQGVGVVLKTTVCV